MDTTRAKEVTGKKPYHLGFLLNCYYEWQFGRNPENNYQYKEVTL